MGWTASNLFHWLSEWSDFTPKKESVLDPTKLSPKRRNIPKGTSDKENAKKKISIQIFLFSLVLIFLKNMKRAITIPNNTPAKLNL